MKLANRRVHAIVNSLNRSPIANRKCKCFRSLVRIDLQVVVHGLTFGAFSVAIIALMLNKESFKIEHPVSNTGKCGWLVCMLLVSFGVTVSCWLNMAAVPETPRDETTDMATRKLIHT